MTRNALGQFARGIDAVISRNGEVLKQRPPPELPPRLYETIADVMRGIVRLVYGVLVNSDLAYRENRVLQRQMRNDPDVMSPLFQREIALALLDWDLVPQDPDDKSQLKQSKKLKKLIKWKLKRKTEFVRHMSDACWFGPSALNMLYQRLPDGQTAPGDWVPFHSDTLIFTETGGLGMRVGVMYKGDKVPVWDGLGHLFSPEERRAVILHTWMPQGPDYEEYRHGRYAFAGRGLRDVCWHFWFIKQQALQYWVKFTERYGMGTRIGTFPSGNNEGKEAMDTALRNLLGDVSVLIPDNAHDNPSGKNQYGISILDPQAGGRQNIFMDLIGGYLAGKIKEMIIGQTATTEATTEGLGTGVSTQHATTFTNLIKYDALCLGDSLTQELVEPLHRMNFGDDSPCPTWRFVIEEVDSDKFLAAVKSYVEIGGSVSKRQVRGRLGLEEPVDEEDTLQGREPRDPLADMDEGAFREARRTLRSAGKPEGDADEEPVAAAGGKD